MAKISPKKNNKKQESTTKQEGQNAIEATLNRRDREVIDLKKRQLGCEKQRERLRKQEDELKRQEQVLILLCRRMDCPSWQECTGCRNNEAPSSNMGELCPKAFPDEVVLHYDRLLRQQIGPSGRYLNPVNKSSVPDDVQILEALAAHERLDTESKRAARVYGQNNPYDGEGFNYYLYENRLRINAWAVDDRQELITNCPAADVCPSGQACRSGQTSALEWYNEGPTGLQPGNRAYCVGRLHEKLWGVVKGEKEVHYFPPIIPPPPQTKSEATGL